MTAPLVVEELAAFYGAGQVLHDVSFAVREGSVTALLGRNGAGKSTLFKALIGLVRRTGSVRWLGREIAAEPTFRIARAGLGWVPEDRRVFTELTVEQNLLIGARAGTSGWTADRAYALFPALGALRRRQAGAMSGGEQQMLAIARTLMAEPRLLLLDEPSEGLAPRVVEQVAAALLELKRGGLALLVSEPNPRFTRGIADDALLLESGRVRFAGSFTALEGQPALLAQTLGV